MYANRHPSIVANAPAYLAGALIVAMLAQPVTAGETSFDLVTQNGFANPLTKLGFNPQPEPPATGDPQLSFATNAAIIAVDGLEMDDFEGDNDSDMEILFAVDDGYEITGVDSTPFKDRTGESTNMTAFMLNDAATGAEAFYVILTAETSESGDPLDVMSFLPDPQPEGMNAIGFSIDTFFDRGWQTFISASLALEMMDKNSDPISFSPDVILRSSFEPAS